MAEKGSSSKDKENGLGQEFNVAIKMTKHKLEKKASKTLQGKLTYTSVTSLAALAFEPKFWDPLSSADWDEEPPSSQCLLRIKRDIMSIYQSPPPGMFIYPDEKVMTKIHALLTGPFETPYEGGFFYFVLRCPPDYPIRPPRVKLMTTGESKVRFNPNLYRNGKVCLSILGTWSGPAWSPAQSLSSILISIQSLLNEKPYFNEPGFEKERQPGDSNRLNEIIRHETLRVAVCDMMERTTTDTKDCPDALKEVMDTSFLEFMDFYNSTISQNIHLTGHKMMRYDKEFAVMFHSPLKGEFNLTTKINLKLNPENWLSWIHGDIEFLHIDGSLTNLMLLKGSKISCLKDGLLLICRWPLNVKKFMNPAKPIYRDPFGEKRGSFDYKSIKERIEAINTEMELKNKAKNDKAKKDQQRTEDWLSDCSSDGS